MQKKYLIILAGPTASGKTRTAIRLSQHWNDAPILNADSRQFYQEMTIGTAKPTPEEIAAAPHYLFDDRSIQEPLTVGRYEAEVLELLDNLFQKQDVVILTGGSGLYIRAVCEGLDEFPEVTEVARKEVAAIDKKNGLKGLQEELLKLDPDYFSQVDQQNPRRLIRALEVCFTSGKPYTYFLTKPKKERPFTTINLCLKWDRPLLYQRINQRVDQMMKDGLLEEARTLYPFRELRSLQTVGYKELFAFFNKEYDALEEVTSQIKQNTRRYAKRQITWFKNLPDCFYFHPDDYKKAIAKVEAIIVNE